MTVKNIIFDLGGVIINLDYQLTAKAFKKLGLIDFENIYNRFSQDNLFNDFEKGTLSEMEFRNLIRKNLRNDVPDSQIDEAWNAMLLDVPRDRMQLLQTLGQNYNIFLLSNTNTIHVRAFTSVLDRQYGNNIFENTFQKVYYSCFMGMRKPDLEIFEKVVNENDLDLKETIFIDDSLQHIEGGKKAGLQSYHLEKDTDITGLIKTILT